VIDLGLYHSWLPPEVYLSFAVGEAVEEHEERTLAGHDYLVAYRRVDEVDVLASPTPLATARSRGASASWPTWCCWAGCWARRSP
jgi:hypothetical protein